MTLTSIELRKAIRAKYAWPGGYPMYCITSDGAALCMDCARKEYKRIAFERKHPERHNQFRVTAVDINWEDTELTCDHCGKQIESAYGND